MPLFSIDVSVAIPSRFYMDSHRIHVRLGRKLPPGGEADLGELNGAKREAKPQSITHVSHNLYWRLLSKFYSS